MLRRRGRAGGGSDGGRLGWEAQRRWKWPRGLALLIGVSKWSSESESESSESEHGEKKLRRVEEGALEGVGVGEARKVVLVVGMADGLSVSVGLGLRVDGEVDGEIGVIDRSSGL